VVATFDKIKPLVIEDKILVSQHAFRRMVSHSIASDDLVASIGSAVVVEDYPSYYAGPAVLVLQSDANGAPFHAVWGIEKGTDEPAVLITTYRPDPALWSDDFRTRKP
jgi:Domain of unknown function (DUF4258)